SPAQSTCPLGPRLMIQPLLDPCHPAERHSGWRRATCPVLLTLTATRLIDVTADGTNKSAVWSDRQTGQYQPSIIPRLHSLPDTSDEACRASAAAASWKAYACSRIRSGS